MNAITETALQGMIEFWSEYGESDPYSPEFAATEMAKHIKDLLEQNRWIPVSEKTPPNLQDVLCFSKDGIFVANCCKGHLWSLPEEHVNDEITHWKPLPNVPEDI